MRGMRVIGAVALLSLLVGLGGCSAGGIDWNNSGAPAGRGFFTKELAYGGSTYKYTVFVPYSYQPGQSTPVIMFLHGVMEAGSNGRKCVTVGLGPTVADRASTFPFIAVFPQSPSDWQSEEHAGLAIATLDKVLSDYPGADSRRVFLTGLSNGGDGTWSVGARYSHRFAGLAPMCGKADYDDAGKLTNIPIWCFHNAVDPFRAAGNAEGMCDKITKLGGNVKYTQFGEFGHDCWTKAYGEGDVFQWMLSLPPRGGAGATAVTPTTVSPVRAVTPTAAPQPAPKSTETTPLKPVSNEGRRVP